MFGRVCPRRSNLLAVLCLNDLKVGYITCECQKTANAPADGRCDGRRNRLDRDRGTVPSRALLPGQRLDAILPPLDPGPDDIQDILVRYGTGSSA